MDIPELTDLGDRSLEELNGLNEHFKRRANNATEVAKGVGGFGKNSWDSVASAFSSRQIKVESEILDRLRSINLTRSKEARIADDAKDAKRTRNPVKWVRNKSSLDYPGVDTKDD